MTETFIIPRGYKKKLFPKKTLSTRHWVNVEKKTPNSIFLNILLKKNPYWMF